MSTDPKSPLKRNYRAAIRVDLGLQLKAYYDLFLKPLDVSYSHFRSYVSDHPKTDDKTVLTDPMRKGCTKSGLDFRLIEKPGHKSSFLLQGAKERDAQRAYFLELSETEKVEAYLEVIKKDAEKEKVLKELGLLDAGGILNQEIYDTIKSFVQQMLSFGATRTNIEKATKFQSKKKKLKKN